MNVTATINGEEVSIVDISADGGSIVISYIDVSENLKAHRVYMPPTADPLIIATGATIV